MTTTESDEGDVFYHTLEKTKQEYWDERDAIVHPSKYAKTNIISFKYFRRAEVRLHCVRLQVVYYG